MRLLKRVDTASVLIVVSMLLVIMSTLYGIRITKVDDPWGDKKEIVIYAPDVPEKQLISVIFALARLEESITHLEHTNESAVVKMRYDELKEFLAKQPKIDLSLGELKPAMAKYPSGEDTWQK